MASNFNGWARRHNRLGREQESLKTMFDNLVATKGPTNEASCPVPVRRAKRIARNIESRGFARVLGAGDRSH